MLTGWTISGSLVRVSYVTSELEVPFFRFQPNMVVTRQKSILTRKVKFKVVGIGAVHAPADTKKKSKSFPQVPKNAKKLLSS
jgi:hypothetical protein